MRSIFARVFLWSLVTVALSFVAYRVLSHAMERHGPDEGDPFHSMNAMIEDETRRAYEEGGPDRLAARLKKLDAYLPGEHIFTDARGRDLVTGADRSALLKNRAGSGGPPRLADGRMILMPPRRGDGGQYRLITLIKPWFRQPNFLPYYGAIVLVIVGMGAILAMHLAVPLRRLRTVVDRFGRGDLAARVKSSRKDEIGELSRAFDDMAGRIETLLQAERRLLQDVSHELRSPLTRLDVAVDLATTSDDPRASLDRIRRDVNRLAVLVNELLQLTRAEGDPSALDAEEVRLDHLLADLVEDCELEVRAKRCELRADVRQPCTIVGERELLHRAAENLIRNAIRHAPADTPIDVGLELRSGTARITVRDRGPGVPEELLASIFEPFFRVEGHRSRSSGGVGLGLAIARRAVGVHMGQIHAKNAGPGLAVTIDLPRAQAVSDDLG